MFAFRKAWVQSSDFEEHPLDPPLSDAGRAEAEDVAKRIAKFIESKGSEIQVPRDWFAKHSRSEDEMTQTCWEKHSDVVD